LCLFREGCCRLPPLSSPASTGAGGCPACRLLVGFFPAAAPPLPGRLPPGCSLSGLPGVGSLSFCERQRRQNHA